VYGDPSQPQVDEARAFGMQPANEGANLIVGSASDTGINNRLNLLQNYAASALSYGYRLDHQAFINPLMPLSRLDPCRCHSVTLRS
jgi:hypothetical protein